VMIALAHDLLITSGVYALTGRQVTTATVAALLTILGYSMYDTIIVFDRVRENIPRMPRAAFSQIVNRSMSEVLTRSIATTACTLMPIVALLLFGGVPGSTELTDFAFALLIGVASGAYSSIFIASPVLTHWKEREAQYRHRRERIEAEFGYVPAYASVGADVEPTARRRRRPDRLTTPEAETLSPAEFEQMKREIAEEGQEPERRTSTLTKRLAHTPAADAPAPRTQKARPKPAPGRPAPAPARPAPARRTEPATGAAPPPGDGAAGAGNGAARPDGAASPDAGRPGGEAERPGEVSPAPDIAENEGMAQMPKRPGKARARNRRHGRRR
jgi:SecD/SecF fusion protein